MSEPFFENPILNSPYEYPAQHWELDEKGQPTQKVTPARRKVDFITPIPKARHRKGEAEQTELLLPDSEGLTSKDQQYQVADTINRLRHHVDQWRVIPNPNDWRVTPETARLLQHWRRFRFSSIRPFFCQTEAVETLIWLTEVAPQMGNTGKPFLDHLEKSNLEANPELSRLALKLATGAGKTTVMAMIIAWQTLNAVHRPNSKRYTRGFLIVTPGITIKDRLRVLLPHDPDSYYKTRELVPQDMMPDLERAKIVITNYHSFKLKERMDLSKGGRALLQGRGPELNTLETEGQMLQRVMPELMGLKQVMVINDEAHHCYREKPAMEEEEEEDLTGDDKKEAESNTEAARLWITGLEAVNRQLGVGRVVDLSATPFFLRGSGYAEGTLFPWTMSDFSLMDAIECGIVKLPRVPVSDNLPSEDGMPVFRNLWEHVGKDLPKSARGGKKYDPLSMPTKLYNAIDALYGHYEKTYALWRDAGIPVSPCFIIVCQNTSISKLVYDYVSGYQRENEDGSSEQVDGRLELFRNHDEHGNPLGRPRTLLIDSVQLESGDALDDKFRKMASDEIERFRREIVERGGSPQDAENLNDSDLLREVMNTVGKQGQLGETIRCVVSVSMLTEGWDCNTVTHVLGIRAFGTQLLCEQVIGRALRRQSYELDEESGLFPVEYADVLGIPFDFTSKPVVAPPQPPVNNVHVKAVRPDRDALEIRYPRVNGYRIELPEERLEATFNEDSVLELTPEWVGPTHNRNEGIIGEGVDLNLEHVKDMRKSSILYHLTQHLLFHHWRSPGEEPKLHLFGQMKRIAKQWLDTCLECKGDTYPAQLLYKEIADEACNRITAAITFTMMDRSPIKAMLDPYNPTGSSRFVNFRTSKKNLWETAADQCHVNWVVLDSDWEGEFCRVAEVHPKVLAYVKNHGLGLEVPYKYGSETRRYLPDFLVRIDDGHGPEDPLNLVVEIKGYRREDAKAKKLTMDSYWIPGVNHLGSYGRWAFAEFTDVWEMGGDFEKEVESRFGEMLETVMGEEGTCS